MAPQDNAQSHAERLWAVERDMLALKDLPGQVSEVKSSVGGLKDTLFREVDGLREQQKAHKVEQTNDRDKYQAEIKNTLIDQKKTLDEVWKKVNNLAMAFAVDSAKKGGWKETLTVLGQLMIGLAVIAEAAKAVLGH